MSFRAFDLLHLVRDFGETLTLRQITTEGAYNPSTGSVDGASTTDTSFTGYMYDYSLMNPVLGSGDTVKISRVVTILSDGAAVCYLCDVEE